MPTDILRERGDAEREAYQERARAAEDEALASSLEDQGLAPRSPTPAPTSGFADLASRISQTDLDLRAARQKREQAAADEQAAIKRAQEGTQPAREAVIARAKEPMPEPVAPVQMAPPPSRGLHDFLAPTPGESPENTITKLIQGVTLLATGFTGLARKDATSALASMKGALEGWQAGDKQRADRAFADWQGQMDKLITEHQSRVDTYKELIANRKLSGDELMRALDIKSAEYGYDLMAAKAKSGDASQVVKELEAQQNHLDQLKASSERLQQMHDDKVRHEETLLEIAKMKRAESNQKQQSILDNYDEPAITALAYSALKNEGRVPSVGMGAAGQVVRGRVLKKMAQIAAAEGIDLSQLPAIAAEMKGAQNEINTASRQLAYWNANVDTFHKHVKQFLDLSAKVDRSGSPVVNRAALKARGQYAGDPEVAAYEAMANEVAMEYAKLAVGTAQGDQSSRAEARDKINASLTPQQIERVMQELVKAGENRKSSWADAVKNAAGLVSTFGGRISVPMPPGGTSPADGPQPGDLVFDKNGKATTFGR